MTLRSTLGKFCPFMSQYAKTSGHNNVVIQMAGNGNSVLMPDQPYLNLTRYLPRRQVRQKGGKPSETDLLSAYTRSVSLVGRQPVLQNLWTWLKKDKPISVRVMVGTAGRGKTRLALELCEKATKKKWGAGFLTSTELTRFQTQQNAADWGWKKPVLVVIDYVSSQAAQVHKWLVELADNSALSDQNAGKTRPLRILLLERQATPDSGWWQVAFGSGGGDAGAVQRLLDLPEPRTLPPILDPNDRREIIAQTLKQAGSTLQLPSVGEDPAFDEKLATLSWGGEPLFLMMAALTAVEAGFAEVLALSRDDLACKIAKRELARIGRIAKAHGIPEKFAWHMAATITLCQGLEKDDAFDAIEREKEALGYDNAGDRATIYKALKEAMPHSDSALDPILPDMIGEAVMLLTWDKQVGSETVIRVLTAIETGVERSKVIASVIRTCQDYARHNPTPLAWLDALGKEAATNLPNLLALCYALPADTIELREYAAALTQTAIGQLRKLSIEQPDAYRPDLAASLNNVSIRLSDLGPSKEALAAGEEAVTLYRDLAVAYPDAFRPVLAGSLNNVSNRLSELGRHEDALTASKEALTIRRDLSVARPGAFLPDLVGILNTVSNHLSDLGCSEEALAAIEEALTLYRDLAAAHPDAFRSYLAMSLNTFSNRLSGLGRRKEALIASKKAVALYRDLAIASPDAFRPGLAGSLNTVSVHLSNLGHSKDALAAIEETITLYRDLAVAYPDAFRPVLAKAYGVRGFVFRKLNCPCDAAQSFGKGLAAIAPHLMRIPQAFASRAAGLRREYLQSAEDAEIAPDLELLQPITEKLMEIGEIT